MKQKSMEKKTRKNRLWALALLCMMMISATALTACGDDELEVQKPKLEDTKITPKISGKYINYKEEIIIDEEGCEISESCKGFSLIVPDYIKTVSLKRFRGCFTDENQWFIAGTCTMKLIGDSELFFENGGDMKVGTIYLKGNGNRSAILTIRDFAISDFEIKTHFKAAPGWVVRYSDVVLVNEKEQIHIEVDVKL